MRHVVEIGREIYRWKKWIDFQMSKKYTLRAQLKGDYSFDFISATSSNAYLWAH